MTSAQREIVIEIERIQVIRKRAKTHLQHCSGCVRKVDFVPLNKAAELFESEPVGLLEFIEQNGCHYQRNDDRTIELCVTSLLERMKQLEGRRRLTA